MMAEEKKGFFRRLAEGLSKTRDNIVSGMDAIFNGFSDIDEDFYDEPSEFEDQVEDFKESLSKSIKNEFLEEMERLVSSVFVMHI